MSDRWVALGCQYYVYFMFSLPFHKPEYWCQEMSIFTSIQTFLFGNWICGQVDHCLSLYKCRKELAVHCWVWFRHFKNECTLGLTNPKWTRVLTNFMKLLVWHSKIICQQEIGQITKRKTPLSLYFLVTQKKTSDQEEWHILAYYLALSQLNEPKHKYKKHKNTLYFHGQFNRS